MMYQQYLESPLGLLRLTANETALCEIALAQEGSASDPNAVTSEAAAQLTEYFLKKRQEFSLELAPQGTVFQKRVWAALAKIPYGKVVTYGQIAAAIGQPAAVRASASAVGKNPLPIVLPCHRVVAANGLGGFAWGLSAKRMLLETEGVEIPKKSAFSENSLFTFP